MRTRVEDETETRQSFDSLTLSTGTDHSEEDLRVLRRKHRSTVETSAISNKSNIINHKEVDNIAAPINQVPTSRGPVAIPKVNIKVSNSGNSMSSISSKVKNSISDRSKDVNIADQNSNRLSEVSSIRGQIVQNDLANRLSLRTHSPIQTDVVINRSKVRDSISPPASPPPGPPPGEQMRESQRGISKERKYNLPKSQQQSQENEYFQEQDHDDDEVEEEQDTEEEREIEDMAIRVVVRKRPISVKETNNGDRDVMDIYPGGYVQVHEPKVKVDLTQYIDTQEFIFDDSFEAEENNEDIYKRTIKHLVKFAFDGGKASCFAYGQTGSGKTFTMMGSSPEAPAEATVNAGLYVLAARDVFSLIKLPQYNNRQVLVSCFEIYGGKLFDLLNERSLVKCLEDAKQQVQLPGLTEHQCMNVGELLDLMAMAHSQRSTGSTTANAESSRSHQILQLVLRERPVPVVQGIKKRGIQAPPKPVPLFSGKLSFIDLAGSERGADTNHASKQTRMEGAEINTSLLALKEVIRSLERKQGHTPFRGSKLTQVLKDSFVGDKTRTCMVACVSPSSTNCEHTLNTLRYADRVKEHQGTSHQQDLIQKQINLQQDTQLPPPPKTGNSVKSQDSNNIEQSRPSTSENKRPKSTISKVVSVPVIQSLPKSNVSDINDTSERSNYNNNLKIKAKVVHNSNSKVRDSIVATKPTSASVNSPSRKPVSSPVRPSLSSKDNSNSSILSARRQIQQPLQANKSKQLMSKPAPQSYKSDTYNDNDDNGFYSDNDDNNLVSKNDFSATYVIDKLGTTDLIQRTVELLSAHRSSIASMVEVFIFFIKLIYNFFY